MSHKPDWRLAIAGLFFLLFCGGVSFAVEVPPLPRDVDAVVSHLPIQYNGRVKPFDSFSREILNLITGSHTVGKGSPVATVLHIVAFPEKWENEPILSLPYRPLREELGLSPKESRISYQALIATRFMKRLPAIVQKQEENEKLTMLENEIMDLYSRFTTLHRLLSGDLTLIPSANNKDAVWLPLTRLAELKEADRKNIQEKPNFSRYRYRDFAAL